MIGCGDMTASRDIISIEQSLALCKAGGIPGLKHDAGRDTGAVFMILPVTTVLMAIIAGIISRVNKAYNQSLFISTGSLFFALQPAALT